MGRVRRPFEKLRKISPNKSSRNGVHPRLIVLHDTESHDRGGTSDIAGVLDWFYNPASQVSAHVVVDAEGHSGQCVADEDKAWHCMNFNSASLGIEQIGYATFTAALWNRNARHQLKKTAQYIAYWSNKYGIPIQKGAVSQNGTVRVSGVVTHSMLGASGGGHHDPGPNYPFWLVLRLAKSYKKNGWK